MAVRFPAVEAVAAAFAQALGNLERDVAALRQRQAQVGRDAEAIELRRANMAKALERLRAWNTKADPPPPDTVPGGEDTVPGGGGPPPGDGAVVGSVRLENASASPLPAGIATFAQTFAPGEVPGTIGGLTSRIDGALGRAQIDVKTRWPDGSAKHALVAVERPALPPGGGVGVELLAAAPSPAPTVDLAAALAASTLAVVIDIPGRAPIAWGAAEMAYAVRSGAASPWRSGPLVSEARVALSVDGTSLRVVADLSAYADGGLRACIAFANDRAMEAVGGRLAYTATVTLAGQSRRHAVDQRQYTAWGVEVASSPADGGQGAGGLHVRHEARKLSRLGAISSLDWALAVPEAALASYAAAAATPGWRAPLADNGVVRQMPIAGGRPDIGITCRPSLYWLMSQDPRAAEMSIGWAEAAGAFPWRHWDAARGTWVNAEDYPLLWSRGDAPLGSPGDPASAGLTQRPAYDDFVPETAHQPDLCFVPYLLTGERWMLDGVLAQAAWNTVANWPGGERQSDLDGSYTLVVRNVQTRGAAWAIRSLENAAWAAPEGTREASLYRRWADHQWAYLVAKSVEWGGLQGEPRGWFPGASVWQSGNLSPWQDDYLASVTVLAAARGVAGAVAVLAWTKNFLIGRFEQDPAAFNPRDGMAYAPMFRDPAVGGWAGVARTWAEAGALTVRCGVSNGDGWDRSQANYGQWALSTLAAIFLLDGDPRAKAAYDKMVALNPPFTDAAAFARDAAHPVTLGVYGRE